MAEFWELFLNPTNLVGFICPIKKVGLILGRPSFKDPKKSSIKKVRLICPIKKVRLKL